MLDEIEDSLSYEDKIIIGQNLRKIFDSLNMPCENFTPIDVMQYAKDSKAWYDEGFPLAFQEERLAYLDALRMSDYKKVYCHGDTHCQNILVDDNLNVYLIDFADAMYAPAGYEQSYVASALLCFEKPYMKGYFGVDYDIEEILDLCMIWLPVHAWGHATIDGNFESVEDINSFAVLKERLRELIEKEYEG